MKNEKILLYILFITFLLVSILPLLLSDDSQLSITCGGDNELSVDCIGGDLQLGGVSGGWDNVAPVITFISPINGTTYNIDSNFPLNVTVSDTAATDTCIYNVVYESVFTIVSNTTITCNTNTTFNTPISGTYKVSYYANDTPFGNMGYNSSTFEISLQKPATNLNYPSNNGYINTNTVDFNFTTADSDGIDHCELWNNVSGTFINVQNLSSISNNVKYNITRTVSDGYYKWDVICEDNIGTRNDFTHNNTMTVDTIIPNVSILTINNTNISGLSFAFKYNISDDVLMNTCSFTLLDSSGVAHVYSANSSLNCSDTTRDIITTKADTFTLRIWGTDAAGNVNTSVITITTTNVPSLQGGNPNVIVSNETGWTMLSESGTQSYELSMIVGSSRTKPIYFENTGTSERVIDVICDDTNSSIGICNYVTIKTLRITLPVQKEFRVEDSFTVDLPKDFKQGFYTFNIKGVDNLGRSAYLTVKLSTDVGIFTGALLRIVYNVFPYFFIYLLLVIILSFLLNKALSQTKLKGTWSMTISVITSLFMGILITGLIP